MFLYNILCLRLRCVEVGLFQAKMFAWWRTNIIIERNICWCCLAWLYHAGFARRTVRDNLRSLVSSVLDRGTWCSDYSGTMGGRDVLILSALSMKYADLVRCVGGRVIPSPGRLGEVVAKIVFGWSRCSISNFSKSLNAFCPKVFFIVFSHVAFDWWSHVVKQMRNARD